MFWKKSWRLSGRRTKPPRPTDSASAQASAKVVHSKGEGRMRERRSEPDVTKSSHIRTTADTARDESESRQEAQEGEQDCTQMRRASGITRSKSDLDDSGDCPTRRSREPGGCAAMPTERVRTKLASTKSHEHRGTGMLVRIQECQGWAEPAEQGREPQLPCEPLLPCKAFQVLDGTINQCWQEATWPKRSDA